MKSIFSVGIIAFLALMTALAITWVLTSFSSPAEVDRDRINVALRSVAHNLLRVSGDSTSLIPPVEVSGHTFRIRFEKGMLYDHVPELLQHTLDQNQIKLAYQVYVRSCELNDILLGYTREDYLSDQAAACMGRDAVQQCQILEVAFTQPSSGSYTWVAIPAILLLLAAGGYQWFKQHNRPPEAIVADTLTEQLPADLIHFGQSSLDPINCTLRCNGDILKLTYREAKLLHLLAQHPNQLLTREAILEQVWADEGILVGRSVDMFISRLRKKLKPDSTIGIVAVHGIGYRLEIG